VELGEEVRQASQAQGDQANLCFAYYVLTGAFLAQGAYQTARRYAQQAYEIAKALNNRWFLAYCLNEWGNVARAMADYAEARQHYQASYAIRNEFNDPEGMAVALSHLGQVAMLEENYTEAKRYYQQSFATYQDLYDRGGLATSLNGLGTATCALGDYQAARQYFHRALEIAVDIQFVPLTLSILIGIGELLIQTDRQEQGLQLLAFTYHHSGSDQETKDRAQKYLTRYQAELSPELFTPATQRGQTADFETIIATVQLELSPTLETELAESQAAEQATLLPANLTAKESPLVEPLTSRELEVLQLISSGLTNQQIADELVISVGTAKWYTGQIYSKLNVANRTQAVARARELEILA
jgi:ATP/maltotriose-dependent transcriptional regulator MalT